MASKKAITPKAAKPASKAEQLRPMPRQLQKTAKRVTRENTNSREEVRKQTTHRQAHPK
jgi:hypothetical protein